jgi:two-component system, OmpR family, response regulator QseB
MELLLIGDGTTVGDSALLALQRSGMRVRWARNRATTLRSIRLLEYDVLLLDLNVSWISGVDLIARLRKEGNHIPIIVLCAGSEILDRVTALDAGADDFIGKPFDLDELIARIRALHRRHSGWEPPYIQHGALALNPFSRMVTMQGEEIPLSVKEFDILHTLLENKGRVITREVLGEKVYSLGDDVMSNALDVHIHNLRKKLGDHPIQTIRGVGYLIKNTN